ncbi:MAG: YCF48-related protein [Acidobacteriota bacterium]
MKLFRLLFSFTICVYFLFIIAFNQPSYPQTWEKVNLPQQECLYSGADITFSNKENGWLWIYFQKESPYGDYYKYLYRTTDGGSSWNAVNSQTTKRFSWCNLYSTSPEDLTCVENFSSDSLFFIHTTSDGGISSDTVWIKGRAPGCMYFFDKDNRISFSEYRWFTSDGGHTWTKGTDGHRLAGVTEVDFVNERLGWIVRSCSDSFTDAGSILNTTDGGKSWQYQDTIAYIMHGVDFLDSLRGFAVGTNFAYGTGNFYSTTDGGNKWTQQTYYRTGAFRKVKFLDDKNGWITCGVPGLKNMGAILRTTDGGKTWTKQIEKIGADLRKMILLKADKVAYVFGDGDDRQHHFLYKADLSGISEVSKEETQHPKDFNLEQNYPNPFNSSTTIEYSIDQPSNVKLIICNSLGKEVKTATTGYHDKGPYKFHWDGRDNNRRELPSGVYFYRLITENKSESKKLILLK